MRLSVPDGRLVRVAYAGELVEARVSADLAPYVARACGYAESTDELVVRREVPISRAVLILGLGNPIGVGFPEHGASRPVDGFVAGFSDTYAVTTTRGTSSGLQLELTPRGANALLSVPMDELANRIVAVEELADPGWLQLQRRVSDAADWSTRLALVADALRMRLAAQSPDASREIAWAWEQIDRTGGVRPVNELAREIGWSRRHFGVRFRREVGLPPKTMARVVRFERAYRIAKREPNRNWSEIAARCGYADQSHLVRDFRDLAGLSPTALMTEGEGDIPFVQAEVSAAV